MAFKMMGMSFGNKSTKPKTKSKKKNKNNKQGDDVVKNIHGDVYDKKTILLNKEGKREF